MSDTFAAKLSRDRMWPSERYRTDLPLVELSFSSGAMLIVESDTGVQYTNQAGGTACLHPCLEGYLVPLGDAAPSVEQALENHFMGDTWRGSGARGKGIGADDADAIDSILLAELSRQDNLVVAVDRDRLDECDEAWIRVHVYEANTGGTDTRLLRYVSGPVPAVLTWENSD